MGIKQWGAAAVAATSLVGLVGAASPAGAGEYDDPRARLFEVTVKVTNLAPDGGTFQTPIWVGVHDGSFDLYDRGQPASPGLERLAEDGTVGPLAAAFDDSGAGVDGTVFGAGGPIAPGETTELSFFVDAERHQAQYFSYASMVIPSNDAFVANGDPLAHRLFNDRGRPRPVSFVVSGDQVLDAGTEVNDELPANTAFFGQATPDTGVVEGAGVELHPGFNPVGSGGILDSAEFANADFSADGYDVLKFEVSAERVGSRSAARLSGANEVPEVDTRARGRAVLRFEADGDIDWRIDARRIDKVLFAHIHIGQPGENGPVAATLFDGDLSKHNRLWADGELNDADLVGPLAGMTTLDLWEEIKAGNAYVNVHTEDFPGGELRADLD